MMNRLAGPWLTAVAGLALVSAFVTPQTPSAAADEPSGDRRAAQSAIPVELLGNGSFDGGIMPWASPTNTATGLTDGTLNVTVPGGTANPWDAMVSQRGFTVQSGTSYTLGFDARANTPATAVVTVQLGSPPYTNTLTRTVSLGTTTKRFTMPFTSSLGTADGEVTFQLGGGGAYTFYLDNVSLIESGGPTQGNPLERTDGFYVDPDSSPKVWVKANPGHAWADRISSSIADQAMGRWFGEWSGSIEEATSRFVSAAAQQGKLPILVAYNIPGRDCSGHSGGGAGSPEAYRAWIQGFASGIGNRPAIVIIEPDSLAQLDCLPNDGERQIRTELIKFATEQFKAQNVNTWAYVDAAHAGWFKDRTDEMAQRLHAGGIGNIRGFVSNVSNFQTAADSVTYSDNLNARLSARYGYTKPFAVDTSRNGNGSNGEWCNPPGRKLGVHSQTGGDAELLLWVKVPGDSDGNCGTAPGTPAGQFDPELARRLILGE